MKNESVTFIGSEEVKEMFCKDGITMNDLISGGIPFCAPILDSRKNKEVVIFIKESVLQWKKEHYREFLKALKIRRNIPKKQLESEIEAMVKDSNEFTAQLQAEQKEKINALIEAGELITIDEVAEMLHLTIKQAKDFIEMGKPHYEKFTFQSDFSSGKCIEIPYDTYCVKHDGKRQFYYAKKEIVAHLVKHEMQIKKPKKKAA